MPDGVTMVLRYTILVGPRKIPIEIEHDFAYLPKSVEEITELVERQVEKLHMYHTELQDKNDKHRQEQLQARIKELLQAPEDNKSS